MILFIIPLKNLFGQPSRKITVYSAIPFTTLFTLWLPYLPLPALSACLLPIHARPWPITPDLAGLPGNCRYTEDHFLPGT